MRTQARFLEQAAAVHHELQQELGYAPFAYNELPAKVPNHLSILPWCNTCDAPFPKSQKVSDHLSGHGCQRCGGNERWTRERLERTIEERNLEQYVVVDRNSIPSDDELKADTLLTLHCRAHGHQRTKTVSNFVNNGSGPSCTRCSIDQRNLNHTNERSRVIELANMTHVDPETGLNPYFYDRLTSERITRRDRVEIGCSQCLQNGHEPYFSQRVGDHLSGHGCNRCNNRSFRPDRPGRYYELEFYAINDPQQRTLFRKGGITNLTVAERVYRIQCGMRRAGVEFGIRIVAEVYFEVGQDAHDLEQAILDIRDENETDYTPLTPFHGSTELFALPSSPMQFGVDGGLIEENQIVWHQQEDDLEE
ncbi:MAG: hypothetical protein VX831_04525 [Candidatus Thermoplasmatota archaeon]|nr:hypothetical protein [Candidatus Thermoplasmatota archaeon]